MSSPRDLAADLGALQTKIGLLASREVFLGTIQRLRTSENRVSEAWVRRYLEHFNKRPFLTSPRVHRIFDPLTKNYLECLEQFDLNRFVDELRKSARLFFELSTPFEEVLLCVHLFKESCASLLTEDPLLSPDPQALMVLDELAQFGTSVMALAYFKDVQAQWERRSVEARDENETMRHQIENLERDLFSMSSKHFSELDRAVSRINRKLEDSAGTRYREVYELSRRLEHARDVATAVGILFRSALKLLPASVEICVGLLDERKTKIRLYIPRQVRSTVRAELTQECRLSVIVPDHRELLFETPFRKIVRRDNREDLELIFSPSRLQSAKEYGFFPLAFHDEPLGFMWAASADGGQITQERAKLLERFAKTASASIFGLQNFLRNQKHAKLVAAIEKDLTPERTLQWEESLDRYLNVFLELTGVERASLMILDPKENRLRTFAAKGYRVYPFSGRTFGLGEGIAGVSLKDMKSICISRMKDEDGAAMAVKSLACIPLWRQTTPIGVLNLSTLTFHKTFEASEMEMVQRIARRLSETLSNLPMKGLIGK